MTDFKNTLSYAKEMDNLDPLRNFKDKFHIPQHQGKPVIYLCGNSLGLQPKSIKQLLDKQLESWSKQGVEAWFTGNDPWLTYHHEIKQLLSPILGADVNELTCMNSLTVNLHLLMVSFYQPKGKRYKILMEAGAFPSDQYAVESQLIFRNIDPEEGIIEIFPREGEFCLRTEDIISKINQHKDEIALILFGGINYYTGQLFDIEQITNAGHAVGAFVGMDLAHAAGNVPLQLHNWNVDFASWCSYKYMNSGPGGISGIFINEKHFNTNMKRFAGWWGYKIDKRFKMEKGFAADAGAEGWQISTSPILLMAVHKAALKLFDECGGINILREKSLQLTAYLEFLVLQLNNDLKDDFFKIITPSNALERGCQLSIICKKKGKLLFDDLVKNNIIGDWREPDVIRLSPIPFYNSFEDIYMTVSILRSSIKVTN